MAEVNTFKQYIKNFIKDTEDPKCQSHLAFPASGWVGGKYNVPQEQYDNFYKTYYNALMKGEQMYLIEKVQHTDFAFFLDIEVPKADNYVLTKGDVNDIINLSKKCILTSFKNPDTETIISRRAIYKGIYKYHVNFPNIIVNSALSQKIAKEIIQAIKDTGMTSLITVIDTSVYRTGLRLFGSQKNDKECKKERDSFENNTYHESTYKIYDIENDTTLALQDTSLDMFLKTIVRRTKDVLLSELSCDFSSRIKEEKVKKSSGNFPVKGVDSPYVLNDLSKFLTIIKTENPDTLYQYDFNEIGKVVATQNKAGIFCYYITMLSKFCPFKEREHTRASSPLYIEVSINGVFVKCYDEDCLRKKYPDSGIKLPDNFEVDYPELYMSMTTRYWKSEITVSAEVRHILEDSLSMSHYKIAKVAYSIYKDRFRIDDIKNPDWYEFDGNKWKKTHIMNILISEELQKYYRSIKINDNTSQQDIGDLQEFIKNKDKLESNMRNELVDTVINKLENVSFKKNVLNEMYYLFKSLEPNFVSKLDSNPYLIGFKNGVYDLETNKFRAGKQNDYLTYSTGYDYIDYSDENIEVQEIYEFLGKIIPNKKVLEYLLKILGRSLVGIPDEHFYILTGLSGANGKSTLINFLEDTLGDYTTAVDVSLLTNKRAMSASASPDVIRLKGKRIVSFAEPEYGDTLKTGILKAFSGGDSIVARELYKAPVAFKLQASMLLACNDLPNISSIDGGTFRRLRVIEFKSRFCDNPKRPNEFQIDPTIRTKLKNWRPYFMSILIHWFNKYENEISEKGRIDEPDEVMVATSKYKEDNDKFTDFFEESVSESSTVMCLKTIYGLFSTWWCNNNTGTKIPDIKELRRALKIKYIDEIEYFDHGIKHIGFNVKVRLNTTIDSDVEDEY